MNIFAVDEDPERAARALCDRHVVKMVLETAQILCTVARGLGHDAPYRATHVRHPCVVWAAARRANWDWLVAHGRALADEYTRRYGREHPSGRVIEALAAAQAGPLPSRKPRDPFVQAMPEPYRGDDPVAAYRRYYVAEKARFCTWRAPAKPPRWFTARLRVAARPAPRAGSSGAGTRR